LSAFVSWLSTHEYIAIWLEGIALVAIFIWDRLDSRADHEQTMAQLRIAQQQAATSQASVQSVINAERAWVVPELRPHARRFADGSYYRLNTSVPLSTEDVLAGKHLWYWLKLTNMGKTPAQILGFVIRYSCLAEGLTDLPKDADGDAKSYQEFHYLLGADSPSIEISEPIDVGRYIQNDLDAINAFEKTGVIHGWVKYRHMFSTTDDCCADFCYVYTPNLQRLSNVGRLTKQRQEKTLEALREGN
jgi:hypothetical protein